jgi:hypothetical protein
MKSGNGARSGRPSCRPTELDGPDAARVCENRIVERDAIRVPRFTPIYFVTTASDGLNSRFCNLVPPWVHQAVAVR